MKQVLLVEDDVALRIAYSLVLDKSKITYDAAEDGMNALELVLDHQYEIIMLDVILPEVIAPEFLRRFRPADHPGTHVIIFSETDSPEIRQSCEELGAHEYIVKAETTPHDIIEHIKALLAKT